MSMKPTDNRHEALYQELLEVLKKHDLSAVELLAVVSNMVGQILAMQNQRTMTVATGMEIIARNVEEGNRQVVAAVRDGPVAGSA